MTTDILEALCRDVDARQPSLWIAENYYRGTQPLSFLSPDARQQLGDRLTQLAPNYPRLVTDSVAERLQVTGFTRAGQSLSDVWGAWRASGMLTRAADAILETLTVGQSFLTVWADASGRPTITVDSPREMAVSRDPLTGEILWAVKRWRDVNGKARAVLYGADKITIYGGPDVPIGGVMPSAGFTVSASINNPVGVCPVVELTNSEGMWDQIGVPESRQIWSLTDALAKVLSDAMVASESAAMPRRFATGIQIQTDDDGNIIPPFSPLPGNLWMSENTETNFGSFAEPKLDAYASHVEILIRQIGAISGLPDHLVGVRGVDPTSAEQTRSAEASLVSRAYRRQTRLSSGFNRAAALVEAVQSGGRVRSDVETVWKSPEARTRAQEADAAAKLYAGGILPIETVWADLGYSPDQIVAMRQARLRESVDRRRIQLPPGDAA